MWSSPGWRFCRYAVGRSECRGATAPEVAASARPPGADEPGLVGEHDQLRSVAGVELDHGPAHVRLRRGRADDEPLGDLLVQSPSATRAITSRSRSVRWSSSAARVGSFGRVANSAIRRFVTLGDRSASPPADRADGPDELHRLGVLDEESAGARAQRLEDVLVELERREDDDADRRQPLVRGDRASGGETVEDGHADVHEHHVGHEPLRQLHRRFAVVGLPDDLDVVLGVEKPRKPARTSAWSSASSTEITAHRPSGAPPGPGSLRRAAGRPRAGRPAQPCARACPRGRCHFPRSSSVSHRGRCRRSGG